jgi:hypothetical protein
VAARLALSASDSKFFIPLHLAPATPSFQDVTGKKKVRRLT